MVESCEKYRMELSALLDEQLDKELKTEVEGAPFRLHRLHAEMDTLKSLCQLMAKEFEPGNLEMPDLWRNERRGTDCVPGYG